ncbi:MAG: ABC transporter substrate-binding protein [Candidatus Bathyarchaeota archaeon]
MNSKAVTKIQSVILVVIIVVAAVVGVVYVFLMNDTQSADTIKIGVLADLDANIGRHTLQGAILAAEQINAEGGILGRQVEVIGEDNDIESGADTVTVSTALTRLITYHEVDFVIGYAIGEAGFVCQEIVAEHKKIFLSVSGGADELTQRVLDDYDKYKYYFSLIYNTSSVFQGMTDGFLVMREMTDFNKIGYLCEDVGWTQGVMEGLDYVLPEVHGFDLVYKGTFPLGTFDFSSYFAAAEAAGVEVLVPLFAIADAIPFVKEYYDRQSPMFVYGGVLKTVAVPKGWEVTDGKCEHTVMAVFPAEADYPVTNKTLPTREAYINRWNETPVGNGALAYDIIRFILHDAIERTGTIETNAVIEALEETSVETSGTRTFVFTESHGIMMGENPNNPDADYAFVMYYQWQNGNQVPVYPKEIMDEANATYTFPDWPGPWDNIS